MSVTLAWKDQFLGVSEEFAASFSGFKTAVEQEEDATDSTDNKKKQVVKKGLKRREISLTVDYVHPVCLNPRSRYVTWESMVGQVDYIYLNDEAGGDHYGEFGPPMQLYKVDLSDLIQDDYGRWLKASVGLTFKEYSEEKAAIKAAAGTTGLAPGTNTRQEMKRIQNLGDQGSMFGQYITFQVGSTVEVTGTRWADGELVPPTRAGKQAKIKTMDNSGIRFLLEFPDGATVWALNTGVSLCA